MTLSTQPFRIAPVATDPFPHVMEDGYLEPDLYAALASSFPVCPPSSGPTGYNYFWGDPEYDVLLESSEAWRTFFHRFHSQAFVDYVLAQFPDIYRNESVVDLSSARYVPYQESRADKEQPRIANIVHAPDELWVRVDVAQARKGYDRGPHLDHRRRAATMLIYFCDADEIEMVGGDLRLHRGESGEAVQVYRPRHNRMAMFPCHNASWHSVSPITSQAGPRNFVQISLSSSIDLWKPLTGSPVARASAGIRSIATRAFKIFR
jgi:hypothetical protein